MSALCKWAKYNATRKPDIDYELAHYHMRPCTVDMKIVNSVFYMQFGISRFHTYLFGKHFTLHSDHKPLEMIWRKPLQSAPPILKRLLVKLQGYDFDVEYKPGSTMVLADVLSRLPNPNNIEEIPLDVRVGEICINDTPITLNVDLVNFGSHKQDALRPYAQSIMANRHKWLAGRHPGATNSATTILFIQRRDRSIFGSNIQRSTSNCSGKYETGHPWTTTPWSHGNRKVKKAGTWICILAWHQRGHQQID